LTKQTFFFAPFSPLGGFRYVVAYKNSSKNLGKMNLLPILNKNSPQTLVDSKLDVPGVVRKLVKYVVLVQKNK
jgi:hypothetical protein